jgi:hypothetical protein
MAHTIKIPDCQQHDETCWRWASHFKCAVIHVEEAAELLKEALRDHVADHDFELVVTQWLRSIGLEEDDGNSD